MKERVEYFSKSDGSCGSNLKRAEKVILAYNVDRTYSDINDVLELYHIEQYIDNGVIPTSWDIEFIPQIKDLKTTITSFFGNLRKENIPSVFDTLEYFYQQSFLDIINWGYIKLLDANVLNTILSTNEDILIDVLHCDKIVKKFGNVISRLLMKNKSTLEWLLQTFVEEKRDSQSRVIFFPKEFTLENKKSCIEQYLDGTNPNLNYVRLICEAKDIQQFKLSPKIRLKALKLERKLNDEVLKNGTTMSYNLFCMDDGENSSLTCIKKNQDGDLILCYGTRFIETYNNGNLISYCKEVFNFTNELNFINFISMESEGGFFEHLCGIRGKDAYNKNFAFIYYETMSMAKMKIIVDFLNCKGRSIEQYLKDFYEDYLPKTYGFPKMSLSIPSKDSSPIEKIRTMSAEMDAILRQYDMFAEEGIIDLELLALDKPKHVINAKSANPKKYYVVNQKAKKLTDLFCLLFSDQTLLTYIDPFKEKNYQNFCDLLLKEKEIRYDNYPDYQKPYLKVLLEEEIIKVDDKGLIYISNDDEIKILKHLYHYRAFPCYSFRKENQIITDKMFERGWILEDNHLLSPEERNYFSYYLNNKSFTNGPSIRNTYMHGNNSSPEKEREHQRNYYRILILFVLILIKIEEDLSLKMSIKLE